MANFWNNFITSWSNTTFERVFLRFDKYTIPFEPKLDIIKLIGEDVFAGDDNKFMSWANRF